MYKVICFNCGFTEEVDKEKYKCSRCGEENIRLVAFERYESVKKRATQKHHITYEPERIVRVFKGEHQILTLLQRIEKSQEVSSGFVEALNYALDKIKKKRKVELESVA